MWEIQKEGFNHMTYKAHSHYFDGDDGIIITVATTQILYLDSLFKMFSEDIKVIEIISIHLAIASLFNIVSISY